MLADVSVCKELHEAFHHYIQVYFRERNLQATLQAVLPDLTGFGSGKDERFFSGECHALYRRDIEQCPAPIRIDFAHIEATPLDDQCGIVIAEFDLASEIAGLPFRMDGLRSTHIFVRKNGKWLLSHLHISKPWLSQGEGESFPLEELAARNRELEAMVAERTEELRQAFESVQRLARTDMLTGVANRTAFDENIDYEISYALRYNAPVSMVLIDIDHFKQVNDRYGHLKGDEILHQLAQLVSGNVRDVDTVHRWGGEEFMILLPNTRLEPAVICAEHLRGIVANHLFDLAEPITISLGVTQMKNGEGRDGWIRRVDQALYLAKSSGRNQVRQLT